MSAVSRRFLIKSVAASAVAGGLVLEFHWPATAEAAAPAFRQTFLSIGSDGRIVMTCPVTEIGQGTSTALAMISPMRSMRTGR